MIAKLSAADRNHALKELSQWQAVKDGDELSIIPAVAGG